MFGEVRAAILDLDGTVYYGDELIPGAAETIAFLRERGIRVFFGTNNSGRSRTQVREKLNRMGIDCVDEDVYTSGSAALQYVADNNLRDVWVIGSDIFRQGMSTVTNLVDDPEDAKTLVVGMDAHYDYDRMTLGVRAGLAAETVVFCNEDVSYIGNGRKVYPGCGAMTATIRACCRREPDAIIGKPNTIMMDFISSASGVPVEDIVVIGDSYGSDVMFAKNSGAKSILIGDPGHDDTVCVDSIADVPALFD